MYKRAFSCLFKNSQRFPICMLDQLTLSTGKLLCCPWATRVSDEFTTFLRRPLCQLPSSALCRGIWNPWGGMLYHNPDDSVSLSMQSDDSSNLPSKFYIRRTQMPPPRRTIRALLNPCEWAMPSLTKPECMTYITSWKKINWIPLMGNKWCHNLQQSCSNSVAQFDSFFSNFRSSTLQI